MQILDADWQSPRGLAGYTVAVVGMARAGRAVAAAVSRRGARVLAYDRNEVDRDAEIMSLIDAGMTLAIGNNFPGVEAADAILPSPGLPATAPVLQHALQRGVPVLSEIEVAYRISPAPILGFTGTNGKSTTTVLCGHMLRSSGFRVRVGGNLAPGTPLPRLADTASSGEILVAEISSFQLEWVQEFRPRVGAILNLTEEHLERHGSLQEYAAVKARLLRQQSGPDLGIFGYSFADAYPEHLLGSGRQYRFCRSHPVESGAYMDRSWMRIVGRVDSAEGALPDLKIDISRFTQSGWHNQENAMAATLAALEMGARPDAIERALRTFPGLPHRMELAGEINGVRFINNSMCTNAAAAMASLQAIPEGVVVITGGRSKGLDMRPFGEALAKKARWSILIGETAGEMGSYLQGAGSSSFQEAGTMAEAVDAATSHADPGDTVILLPGFSSFDMFTDFEARGHAFVDAVQRRLENGPAGGTPAGVMPAGVQETGVQAVGTQSMGVQDG